MQRPLTDHEISAITNALYTAMDTYGKCAKDLDGIPANERMVKQFRKQVFEVQTLIIMFEQAEMIAIQV